MSFYDNRTFCCPIPSVIILMLNKSDPSYHPILFITLKVTDQIRIPSVLYHYLSLEGTVFISECCKYLSRMNVDDGSYKQMLNLKTIYHGSFQEEATIFYVILRKRHCTIQNSLVAETYSRTSVLRYTTNRCTIIWQNMAMKRFTCSLKLRPAGKMWGMI